MGYETGFIHRHGFEFLKPGDTLHSVVRVSDKSKELRIVTVLSIDRVPVKGISNRTCTRIGYRVAREPKLWSAA